MGASAFLILFLLRLVLSFVGGIAGLIDAFRVSTVWGLLVFFVPFAFLVYCIKFWNRKWARNALLLSLGGFASMLLSGVVGGFAAVTALRNASDELEEEGLSVEVMPDPNAQPGAEGTETLEVTPEGGEDLFQEAMLPGLPSAAEIARAELLPSTDPNERVKEIERERTDPYAYVPVPVPPKPTPPSATPPAGNNAGNNNAGTPNQGNQPSGTTPGGGGTSQPSNPLEPLPSLPEPTVVASQVQVSGIADVNGQRYAIVRAPGEPSSRYVKVGDRLSNGAVLVKRIENTPGSVPTLILEERGEEIALPVGSNVGTPEESTASLSAIPSDIASLPVLP